jgi:hypothetical protein
MKSFNKYLQEKKYTDKEKESKLSGGKSNIKINPDSESLKEADIKPPAEKLKTDRNMFSIPADEREAAKQRLLAKAKAKREAMQKEEVEQIDEVSKALAGRVVNARIERTGAAADRENKYRTPQNVRDTVAAADKEARARKLAAGVRARRDAMRKEELEIEEGMSMKDFKANRKKNERRAASADAEKRGHVGKEWHNTGRKYSPDEAKSGRANMSDYNRQQRYQTAEDPDSDNADTYPAVKTKNPKKIRKQKAMGEMVSFSDFMEARRMDKEGVDRGDSRRDARAEKAKASLAAVKKGEERKIKVSKKYGIEPSKSDTVEKRAHKRDFAGSRQTPKQKGAKETPQETQNRRINAGNKRRMTHGWTSKEKAANRGMENAGSRFD